jgi:putative heme iron utilization protein
MAEHRLTRALRELLSRRRTAALGTLDPDGVPFVSMVPFAIDTQAACIVIHISALAAHSGHLRASPRATLLVCDAELDGEPVHALARVTLSVNAAWVEAGSDDAQQCRTAYLARFPEAEPMTALGDFRFVRLLPSGARQVAGFGAARSLDATEVAQALSAGDSP